jgi:hypothetical protein
MTVPVDTNDPRWQLMERVSSSPILEKSARLRAFLKFVCEMELTGRRLEINEQQIGIGVFGRPPAYSPGEDSIVRSQARLLRQRLEEYFRTTGKFEPVRITIPKGSYVPLFEPNPELAVQKPAADGDGIPVISPIAETGASQAPWRLLAALGAGVLILICSWTLLRRGHASAEDPYARFWNTIFDPQRGQVIVPADSTLILIEEITGEQVTLENYLNRDYLAKPSQTTGLSTSDLAGSNYTSMADLNLVARLVRIPDVKQMKAEIRYARDLSISEAKEKNLVLIGGPRANPWVELFASRMNFYVDFDWKRHKNSVVNKHPQAGEETLFVEDATAQNNEVYGLIAFQPSLDGEGNALLVAGTSSPATQTAADFLLSDRGFKDYLSKIKRPDGSIPHFELLLQAKNLRGNAPQSNIIASRIDP